MAKNPRISNPYSTGGGGYDFEYLVGTYYLISMLKKSIPLGLEEGYIEKVKFQAKYDGHFLDDIVLICSNNCSLSIQVRRKVKFTERDTEFETLLIDCYRNFNNDNFNPDKDRNCIVVGIYHHHIQNLRQLHEIAKTSADQEEFIKKIMSKGFISKETRNIQEILKKLLEKNIETHNFKPLTNEIFWKFSKSLIVLQFDIENVSGTHYNQCLNDLKATLEEDLDVIKLFSFLKKKVTEYEKYGGTFQYEKLMAEVSKNFKLKATQEAKEMNVLLSEDYKIMRELFFNKDFDGSEEYLVKLKKLDPTNFELKIYSAFINFRKSLRLPNQSPDKKSLYITFCEELSIYSNNYFYKLKDTDTIVIKFFEIFPMFIYLKNFFSDHNIAKVQMNKFLRNTLEAYFKIDYECFNDFIDDILSEFEREFNFIGLLIIGYFKASYTFYYENFDESYNIFYEILSKCVIPEVQELFFFELRIPIFIIIIDICRGNEPYLKYFIDLIRSVLMNPAIKHLERRPIHIFEDAVSNVIYRIRIFQERENNWRFNLDELIERLTPYFDVISNILI